EPRQIRAIRYCVPEGEPQEYNVLSVDLVPGASLPASSGLRSFVTTSACGLCGKASIDTVRARTRFDVRYDEVTIDAGQLASLPARLRAAQRVFDRTGGLHAAGLFDA